MLDVMPTAAEAAHFVKEVRFKESDPKRAVVRKVFKEITTYIAAGRRSIDAVVDIPNDFTTDEERVDLMHHVVKVLEDFGYQRCNAALAKRESNGRNAIFFSCQW